MSFFFAFVSHQGEDGRVQCRHLAETKASVRQLQLSVTGRSGGGFFFLFKLENASFELLMIRGFFGRGG